MVLIFQIVIALLLVLFILTLIETVSGGNVTIENTKDTREIRDNQNKYGKLTEWLVRER